MKPPILLETTLRDGSYVINFQFTAQDTAVIGAELEKAGFELIEVGHGIGLGASRKNPAAESDETYLRVSAETFKKAKWGMFCIPGIATLDDVELAAKHGMKFIRIGTNATDVEQSRPFIERAKKHGMMVCANFMKSYACEPKAFAEFVKQSEVYGSDVVYIVDSAGGMLTSEMESYIRAVRDVTKVKLGFHGHNNLDLAVANSLRAMEMGVEIIDTSLQGLGRSAGNTPTEVFLLLLARLGYHLDIDPITVMDLGEKYAKRLLESQGYDSVDMVSGFAQFHSSYMGVIREFSSKYRVDPRQLIIAVCKENRVDAPKELVERLAKELSTKAADPFNIRFRLDRYHGGEQSLQGPK